MRIERRRCNEIAKTESCARENSETYHSPFALRLSLVEHSVETLTSEYRGRCEKSLSSPFSSFSPLDFSTFSSLSSTRLRCRANHRHLDQVIHRRTILHLRGMVRLHLHSVQTMTIKSHHYDLKDQYEDQLEQHHLLLLSEGTILVDSNKGKEGEERVYLTLE